MVVEIHSFLTSAIDEDQLSASLSWFALTRRLGGLQNWAGRF